MNCVFITLGALLLASSAMLHAVDYPYTTAEPQKTGWPLTDEEKISVFGYETGLSSWRCCQEGIKVMGQCCGVPQESGASFQLAVCH